MGVAQAGGILPTIKGLEHHPGRIHVKAAGMLVGNFELLKPLKETNLGVAEALFGP